MTAYWDTVCDETPGLSPIDQERWIAIAWQPSEIETLSDAELCQALRYHAPTDRAPTLSEIQDLGALVAEMHARCRRHRTTGSTHVPRRYSTLPLEQVTPRDGQRAALHALQTALSSARGCYLSGRTGKGKSYLTAAWMRSAAAAGHRALMVRWLDIARGHFDENARESLREARDAECLVLDDLPGKITGPGAAVLFELMDYRAGGKLPTCVTSNRAIDALEVDDRTRTRLAELCDEEVVG